MASINPQLLKTSALAKTTQLETRVNALVNSSTTELSPVVVYLTGAVSELSVNGSVSAAGSWTCPANINQVQVECYGAGGGGGGGTTTYGGGGGGGGEYACEPSYAVVPGGIYTYAVGRPGQGGICKGTGGWPGGNTVFDTSAVGGGVVGNGGGGGDTTPNNGGTGSVNAIHFPGGAGGVSSTGLGSDNPVALGSIANVGLWWIFKGANTSNGALASVYDDSGRSHTGSVVNREISGLKSAVIASPNPPPQTPSSGGNCAYFSQDLSSKTPSYVVSPAFGLGNGSASAPWDGSAFTVSAWIKSDTTTSSWGFIPSGGRQFGIILANCDVAAGFHTGGNDSTSSGFGLYMLNNIPGFYLNPLARSVTSAKAVAGSALPIDGTWHQVVGTFDGTTMKLYVDGTMVSSLGSLGFTKFGAGSAAPTSGCNAYTKADGGFLGYMSNVWIADVAASSGYVSTAFGASPETGGSGGGASGGSAGTGNPGVSASTTTGAAGGGSAAGTGTQLGSGAGGTGGNANTSAANAPSVSPYGGAGGGAGASSSASAVTSVSVPCIQSASYCGFDAQGGNAGALYSISSQPQTGVPTPYAGASLVSSNVYAGGTPNSAFNGSLTGMVLFPRMVAQLRGFTVNSTTISFTVQSTNASVLPVWSVVPGAGQTELPASWGSVSDINNYTASGGSVPVLLLEIPVPAGAAGRTVTFDITGTALATAAASGSLVALAFGGFQGAVGYDLNDGGYSAADSFAWNTAFTGCSNDNPALNVSLNFELYPSASGNKIGGDGAPGFLVVSYIDPRYWPITAVQPAITTDSDGHTFATGITTDSIVGFDPTVVTPPRVPETWHSLGALAGGSGITIDTARYRYSPEDGGTVVIQVTFFLANSTSVTGGQYAFANVLPAALRATCSATASHDVQAFPVLNFNASNALNDTFFGLVVNGKNATNPGKVILDVNFTGTASGNSNNTVIARIPLT